VRYFKSSELLFQINKSSIFIWTWSTPIVLWYSNHSCSQGGWSKIFVQVSTVSCTLNFLMTSALSVLLFRDISYIRYIETVNENFFMANFVVVRISPPFRSLPNKIHPIILGTVVANLTTCDPFVVHDGFPAITRNTTASWWPSRCLSSWYRALTITFFEGKNQGFFRFFSARRQRRI